MKIFGQKFSDIDGLGEYATVRKMSKVFVGGLSWDTTDESLRKAFEPFGALVSANIISDRETGRSRGFGFVMFEDEENAHKAIKEMTDTNLDGRVIRCGILFFFKV
jgi:RNA recognition motif-containing protein